MNKAQLDEYINQRIKEQKAKRKAEEKAVQKTFDEGGWKDYVAAANHLAEQAQKNPFNTPLLTDYQQTVRSLEKLGQNSSVFSQSDKAELQKNTLLHQDLIDIINNAGKAKEEQNALREQRDEASSESTWNKVGSTVLSALAAMAGGENASNAAQVRETSEAEQDIALEAEKRAADIQKQINKNYEKYVAMLDRKAIQESLHDGSLKGKELKYAKEDFQAADEYGKAVITDKFLKKNKEIDAVATEAGNAKVQQQEDRAKLALSIISNTITGGNDASSLVADFSRLLSSADSAKQKKQNIIDALYKNGFDEKDGITAEAVADFIVNDKAKLANAEKAEELQREIKQLSESFGGRLAGNVAALVTSPLKAIGSFDTLSKTVEGWVKDEKVYIDSNDPIYSFNNLYSNVVSTTSSYLNSEHGKGAAEAYQFSINLADNVIRAVSGKLLGGGKVAEAITLVTMGLGVMNDTAIELSSMGMDAKGAGTLGFVAGMAEIATEALPMEKVMGMLKNKSALGKKQILRNLISQIFTEGMEEGASDIINDTADFVFEMLSDDPSQREMAISRLMREEGLSYDEAFEKYTHDHMLEFVKDVAGGMLSGGIMAGGAMKINSSINNTAAGANIMQYGAGSNRAAFKAEIADIMAQAEKSGQGTMSREQAVTARLNEQLGSKEGAHSSNGNAAYDNVIAEGLQSTDASIRKQAQNLANARDLEGKQSMIGIGRLANKLAAQRTNASIGVAAQIMDEVGASEKIKDTLVSAIRGEELSTKELKALLADENARNLVSDLSGVALDEDSSTEDLQEALENTYGKNFSVIDNSTDYGRAYTLAAELRASGAFGTDESGRSLGTNAMRAFYSNFSDKAGMSLGGYNNFFQLAYNLFYAGKSNGEIAKRLSSYYNNADAQTRLARENIVQAARQAALADKELLARHKAEEALNKKEREKAKAQRRAEKEKTKKEQAEELKKKFKEARSRAGVEQSALEALENGTLAKGESTKAHAAKLTVEHRNQNSKKFLNKRIEKVKQSGGGAVVYKRNQTKLSGKQAFFIAFYEYLGKKRGLTYVFTDALGEDFGGEYKDKVVTVSLSSAASMAAAAGHELGHFIKQNYASEYQELTDYVLNALEANGVNVASRIASVQALYRQRAGQELSEEEAIEEIVNNALFSVDIQSPEFESFMKEHMTLAEAILEKLQEWLKNLEAFFGTVTGMREVEALRGDLEYMQEVADRVGEILAKNGAGPQEISENAQKNSTTAQSGVRYSVSDVSKKIKTLVSNIINNKGKISGTHNTQKISSIPTLIADYVFSASNGEIDIYNKEFALNGDDFYHEYKKHCSKKEFSKDQIPLNLQTLQEALEAFYSPDVVEAVFLDNNNVTLRKSFAYAKRKADGSYVVVVAVGGKYNPTVVPVEILHFSENKWNKYRNSGKVLAEFLFENDSRMLKAIDVSAIKKNRVIVTSFGKMPNLNSHSPRFNTIIRNISQKSNTQNKTMGYSIESNKAVMTQARLDDEIENSGAGSRTDYANSWITNIAPGDFLNLTSQETSLNRDDFDKHAGGDHGGTMDEWDYDSALKNSGTPYLQVDIDSGKVETYDGRHRMRALEKKGIKSVEILVEFYKDGRKVKYATDSQTAFDTRVETKKEFTLKSAYGVAGQEATVYNIIPLNEDHRSEIEASYGEKVNQNAAIKYQVSDTEYMQAARNGDEEKAAEYVEQAAERAFPNSTVRDDNGKLLKLYHGTPNAGFTVFKPESYFTPNKEYADVYQSPGASSNSVKTSAVNPSTYAVYLNIEKPFDTRNAKERDIFYNEFYKQWGNGAPLAESGLPDWTDASDLLEFIEEKGYDYDGIILDEGGTGGYGDEVKSRGLSYVPVNANQIKSADPITYDDNGEIIPLSERFSDSKDIRYSVKDSEGEQLSNGQATYFGDSKVRDKDGNLLRVYHGTYADFTVFDPVKYGGQTGSDRGKGIYFTSVRAIADRYGNSDKVYYLNITKPAFDNKVTLTKSEIEQLVRASAEYEAEKAVDYGDYDDFDEALQDSFVSAYGGTYSAAVEMLLENNYNDVDIIYDIMNAIGANTDFESAIDYYNEVLTPSTGIDGFQTRFTHAADDGMDKSPNVFIAFNSNQAKLTSNTAPTDNKDIRYLVYDTALTDTIREQEAELARAARESGAYKSAVSKRQSFGDKIALIRRQMNTTFKTPTYRPEAVAKVADGFLKEYGVTDILSKDEKQTFTAALHKMYQQLDGAHGLGYLDEHGKYHKPHANAAELADAYAEQAINTIREYMTAANDTQLDDRLQEIKDYFAAKKVVKLTSVQWQELLHLYGSAKEANKDVPYIRFAKAQAGEQNTLDNHWQELNLGADVNEGDQVPQLIETLKEIQEATAATVNYFEQDEDQTELMNEAVFRLQSTWAEVQWQETFADRQKASVALAKQLDEQTAKGGKKTNRNMAQLAQYKKSLEETMRYSEKAIADLQKAYAKENERTLATLRELGAALAAERENSAGLKQDLGEAKANRNAAENKSRELTKTVDELTKNNATLAAYVDSLTEEKKQALIDYAEANKKLRRAEKKVETREKWLEAEKEHRRQRVAELQAQKDLQRFLYQQKMQEKRSLAIERKRKTELKGKLRRKFMQIASLAAANDKKRHVPNGLINAVKDMLSAFNIYENGTKSKVRFDTYLSRIGTAFTRATKDENYESVYGGYSEFINNQIQYIRNKYGIKEYSLSDFSVEELEDINDLVNSVIKFITEGNHTFAENIKENIDELQDRTVAELKESNADKKQEHDRKNSLKQLLVDNMKPIYFFRQAGSATLEKLFTNVYDGENIWANDITEARDKEQELREKYHYYDWNQKEKHSFQLELEKQTLELNVQQIMTLYALSRREDAQGKLVAWDHLLEGGIRKLNGTEARRGFMQSRKLKLDEEIYKFTEKDIKTIVNTLTDEQKHFVQEAQEFLSVDVAKWGNAVSEKLYDVHLFKGKIYFPMQSDKQWVEEKEKKTTGARQIKNFGASQALIKHANNPLVLGEFNDVFGNHIDEMALYHAFVLPLEDMQRVYGYYSTKKNSSVRHLLGRYNRAYIDQLLQDLNGGVKASGDLDFGSRMLSRWKKVSVALNSSVIIQQPSAIGRAFAYIEPKYFKPALPTEKNLEEMMAYAPIARIKSMGYFDVDLGRTATEFINENEYSGLKAKGKAVFTDRNYRENLLTVGAEKADELTWAQIWSAAKQKAKAQGFTGKAQLEKAGEIFTECIRMTQVYDSVFSRSGNMRKKGFLASAATAFMSEPTTAYNMVVDAFSGLKSGRTTKKFAASVAASVLTATVINAMLKAVVQSLRHAGDDDDIIEQYPGEVLGNILDDINPISYIPILKDVYSAFAGNDIERPDMTLISDFAGKIKRVIADPKDGARWVDLAATSAQIFGIPTVSVLREFRQAKNLLSHIFTDERTKPTAEGVLVNIENSIAESLPISSQIAKGAGAEHFLQQNSSDYALIYRLIQSGDQKEAMKRFDILKKSDPEKFTDKTFQSGIRNLLKKDRDITEAAILWNQGKAQEARAKLDAESLKNFEMNDKLAATIARAKELKPVPAFTKASDKDYNDDFDTGAIKNTEYAQKAAQGILDADYYAIEENYNALVQMGYSEKQAQKAIVSMANELGQEQEDYVSATTGRSLKKNALLNDSDVTAAAEAAHAGRIEERTSLQNKLISKGYTMNEVGAAIDYMEKKLYPTDKGDDSSEEKTYYTYRTSDVASYLAAGDTESAAAVTSALVDEYEKAGKTADSAKEAIRKAITAEFKEQYRNGSDTEREKIRQLMYASGAYKNGFGVVSATKWWLK